MGSVGTALKSSSNRIPGTITYSDIKGTENPLQEDEIRLLQNDKNFSFDITNNTRSGAPRLSIFDESGSKLATATLWYDEVEVHNKFTGSEDIYKNLRLALSGIRRRWNNRNKKGIKNR